MVFNVFDALHSIQKYLYFIIFVFLMKFYLSSYKLGQETDRLNKLVPRSNRRIGYIFNGMNFNGTDHPKSANIDKEVDYCKKHKISFKTLRDGEAIIIA